MNEQSKERLSELIENLKSQENYLNHDSVVENGMIVNKVYVKSLEQDDINNNQGLQTFTDSRGSGFVLSTPLENDNELYVDLEDDKYEELEEIFLSGDENRKNDAMDELLQMNKDNIRIKEEQKKRLVESAVPVADKLIMLKMLNDKNPEKTIGLDYKKKKEEALSKSPSKSSSLLQGAARTIEKLGSSSQID